LKIYTRLILDLATNTVIEAESFDYAGPVAQAGGSSKGGGGSSGGGASGETSLTRQQADISKKIFEESTPLRQSLVGSAEEKLGMTPSFAPSPVALFGPNAPERQAVEAQYGNAKENILSTVPMRGSELNRNLVGLEAARAGDIGQLEANATNQALALGSDIGLGTTATTLSGLNAARIGASAQANRQAQESASSAGGKGLLLGGMGGKPR
jgi:hypothetical protein